MMILKKGMGIGISAAVLLAPTLGRAEWLKNFKADSSIEVRAFSISNESDRDSSADDYRGETRTRLIVGGSFDLLDDVHARVKLVKNNRLHGQAAENANSVQTAVAVQNASMKIDKVFGAVDMTIGRQDYNDERDLVIYFGPQWDDVLSVTALDAFRVDTVIANLIRFKGIAGKTFETTPVSATNPPAANFTNTDSDVWGGELGVAKEGWISGLAAYYYSRKNKAVKPPALGNDSLYVAGARYMGAVIAGLDLHAEYIQNFGRDHTAAGEPAYDGNAYFLGLGHERRLGNFPFRIGVEYGRGTNNFTDIAAGKRFGIIWGEHTNNAASPSNLNGRTGAGLGNLEVFDGTIGINPIEKLGIDVSAYRFLYDDGAVAGGKTSIGTEYDLVLSWKHSDNVSFQASAASFQVGDAIENTATPTNPITRLGGDVVVKF